MSTKSSKSIIKASRQATQLGLIEHAFVDYYEELLNQRVPNEEGFARNFLSAIPHISRDVRERLEEPISFTEILEAIDEMPTGKTPGPDGSSAAFFF